MRVVDLAATVRWLDARGLLEPGTAERMAAEASHRGLDGIIRGVEDGLRLGLRPPAVDLLMPDSAGQRTILARQLALLATERATEDGLLWIYDWGAWPNAANMDLFDGYRRAHGVRDGVHVRPGHIVGPDDRDPLFSLMCLALYFSWGVLLVRATNGLLIQTDHHDRLRVHVAEGRDADRLAEEFAWLAY